MRVLFGAVLLGAAVFGAVQLGRRCLTLLTPQPTRLLVRAVPTDATIVAGRYGPVRGLLRVPNAKPGRYRLRCERRGFVTAAGSLLVVQGRSLKRVIRLKPKLLGVTVTTRPAGVRLRVAAETGTTTVGRTPFSRRLAAGRVTLSLRAAGYNTIRTSFFLDGPRRFELWMDPKGLLHRCLSVFNCGPSPKQVLFSPDGRELWVSTMGATGVEVYNWRNGRRLGRVDLGPNGAVEVVFTRDGKTVYASQMQTASVFRINARTRKVSGRFSTTSAWTKVMALSPNETLLYAANWSGNNVTEIDLATGKARRQIATVKTPRGLYVSGDGRRLFVAGFEKGQVERIDLRTGVSKVLLATGGAMRHLVGDERRGVLYADDMSTERVYTISLKTGAVRTLARTDHKPNTVDLAANGRVLYVSCRGENGPSYYVPGPEWGSVLAIDTRTGKALDAIVGGNQCTGLDVSDDGRYLAFSDFLDGRVHVYEIPAYRVLAAGRGGRYRAHLAELAK